MKPMLRRRPEAAFTLIELLIAIALMMILMVAVTMIFVTTTETVAIQDARITVYTNARYALDIMENDLLGAFGLNEPAFPGGKKPGGAGGGSTYVPTENIPQAFWMDNGELPRAPIPETARGEMPKLNGSADPRGHIERAGDAIGFRSVTTVGNTVQTCEVTYILIPGDHVLDSPAPNTSSTINKPPGDLPLNTLLHLGDTARVRTVRSNRPLYTLIRRVRVQNPTQTTGVPAFDLIPVVTDQAGNKVVIQDQELCYFVVSFNLEYLSSGRTFSQLAPSPFPHDDPLGNNLGLNDTPNSAYRVPAVRVTMRVVEDIGERQERTIQKVMWIPQQ